MPTNDGNSLTTRDYFRTRSPRLQNRSANNDGPLVLAMFLRHCLAVCTCASSVFMKSPQIMKNRKKLKLNKKLQKRYDLSTTLNYSIRLNHICFSLVKAYTTCVIHTHKTKSQWSIVFFFFFFWRQNLDFGEENKEGGGGGGGEGKPQDHVH